MKRTPTSRRRVGGPLHGSACPPRLEVLEDRLLLGDGLLGAALVASLAGPSLAAQQPPEDGAVAGRPAGAPQVSAARSSAPERDGTRTAPVFTPAAPPSPRPAGASGGTTAPPSRQGEDALPVLAPPEPNSAGQPPAPGRSSGRGGGTSTAAAADPTPAATLGGGQPLRGGESPSRGAFLPPAVGTAASTAVAPALGAATIPRAGTGGSGAGVVPAGAPGLTVSLASDKAAPQLVGEQITWTATADGGSGDLVYQFRVGATGGSLRVVRDFSAANTFTWAPMQEGTYDVAVTVAEGFGSAVTADAVASDTVNSRVTGTDPVVTATANPLVALYSAPPGTTGAVHVDFRPAGSPDAPWMSTDAKPSVPGQSTNFLVAGMLADTTYEMVGVTGNGYLAPVDFTTGSPPADLVFPDFTVVQAPAAGSDPSQNMVLHFAISGASPNVNILATDLTGRVDWYYDPVASGLETTFGVSLVPGGTILLLDRGFGAADILREADLAGNTLRETNVDAVNAQLVARGQPPVLGFHHDAQRLPNGDTAVLAQLQETIDVDGTPTDYLGDVVIVLDQDFQVKWTWNSFDYLDTSRLPPEGEGPADWLHSNAVNWSPADGDLMVSIRSQDWVIKIDYRNGAGDGHVVWRLGQDGDFTTDSSDPYPWFTHQHNAHYLADGTLILFDNGNTRVDSGDPSSPDSRGQVWSLNEQTMQATLVRNVDLGNYSLALGSAQELPDGNYVFTSGFQGVGDSPFGQSIEVLPDGTPTYVLQISSWEYRSFQMSDLYADPALDGQPPTVLSVGPSDPNPTAAGSVVHFSVVFDQAVQGVDPGAFSVSTDGTLAGAAVESVTQVSGSAYSVAVDTGSGSGDLGLNVLANGHIRNTFGVPLAAGASSGAATYSVFDGRPPTVLSVTPSDPNPTAAGSVVHFTVVFDQAVQGVDPGAFSVSAGGTLTGAAVVSVTPVSGPVYSVAVNTGSGSGDLGLNVLANGHIQNAFGVPLAVGASSATTYSVLDGRPPTVLSVMPSDPNPTTAPVVHFTVAFDQAVQGVDPGAFSVSTSGSLSGAAVTSVTQVSGSTYSVAVSTGSGSGDLGLNVLANGHIRNTFGVPLAAGASSGTATYSVNRPPSDGTPNPPPDGGGTPSPPSVDLNGAAPGIDYATAFSQNGPAVLVEDPGMTVTDPSSPTLTSATVTITNRQDGALESLSADTTGTGITANYNAAGGVLTLTGTDTLAHYQQVLRTVRYNNVSTSPGIVPDRRITFTVSDGTLSSATAVTTLKVRATDKVGVVRPDGNGSLVISLDTNGNGVFDAGDRVFHFGLPGDQVIVGDWNGDGRSKIGVVRPDGQGSLVFSLDTNGDGVFDAGDRVFHFGLPGDQVIVGDWNGDGRSKVGVVRPTASGVLSFSLDTNGTGFFDASSTVLSFGRNGDRVVVGDWNGDGKSKVGVARGAPDGTAVYSLDTNGNGVFDSSDVVFHFGLAGDQFLVGDWNADGKSKVGVVRGAPDGTAVFALDTVGNGTFDPAKDQVLRFGLADDMFVVGKWRP